MSLLTFLLQVFETQGLPLSRVGRGGAGQRGPELRGWVGGSREGGQEGLTLLWAPGLHRTTSGQSTPGQAVVAAPPLGQGPPALPPPLLSGTALPGFPRGGH